jgi:hypothetical protein
VAHWFDRAGDSPKTRRRSRLFVVLGSVLLLIGCEAGVGTITGTPLSAVRTIPDTGITLSPPGSMTPTVSADRAYDLCRTHVADCDSGAPTAVVLALMTDTGSNIVEPNTLVWVFSWLGSSGCFFSGGGNPAPNTPAVTPKPICDKYAFIDARTATFYFTNEDQHP